LEKDKELNEEQENSPERNRKTKNTIEENPFIYSLENRNKNKINNLKKSIAFNENQKVIYTSQGWGVSVERYKKKLPIYTNKPNYPKKPEKMNILENKKKIYSEFVKKNRELIKKYKNRDVWIGSLDGNVN
jgi:hypothetical protein